MALSRASERRTEAGCTSLPPPLQTDCRAIMTMEDWTGYRGGQALLVQAAQGFGRVARWLAAYSIIIIVVIARRPATAAAGRDFWRLQRQRDTALNVSGEPLPSGVRAAACCTGRLGRRSAQLARSPGCHPRAGEAGRRSDLTWTRSAERGG